MDTEEPLTGACFLLPHHQTWARVSRVLVLLSVIQCFTSIYIYMEISRRVFFAFYLAYAVVSFISMVFRAKYGLLWFGLGSLLYSIWLSVDTWNAVRDKKWVDVCFDFTLTAFEFLVFCLTISRFHELGGFTICFGPPNRDWKGRLLVGGSEWQQQQQQQQRQLAASYNNPHHAPDSLVDEMAEDEEREVYLNQNLLAHAAPMASGGYGQQRGSVNGGGVYVPPPSENMRVRSETEEDMFSPASHISSASSSYTNSVGRGILITKAQQAAQAAAAAQQQHFSPSSIYSPNHSFKLESTIPDMRTLQLQQQEQRDVLSRESSFTGKPF